MYVTKHLTPVLVIYLLIFQMLVLQVIDILFGIKTVRLIKYLHFCICVHHFVNLPVLSLILTKTFRMPLSTSPKLLIKEASDVLYYFVNLHFTFFVVYDLKTPGSIISNN